MVCTVFIQFFLQNSVKYTAIVCLLYRIQMTYTGRQFIGDTVAQTLVDLQYETSPTEYPHTQQTPKSTAGE